MRFVLRQLGFFSGTLTASRGRAVPGAEVRIRNLDTDRQIYIDRYSADVTDSDGKFTIALPSGRSDRFVADVQAHGWVPQSTGVLGSGSTGNTEAGKGSFESVRISLESQGASVSGTVASPSGSGLNGITVLVHVRSQPANTGSSGCFTGGPGVESAAPSVRRFRARIKTDSSGRYAISGLPPGSLVIMAVKRSVRIPAQRFNIAEGGSYVADFVLRE